METICEHLQCLNEHKLCYTDLKMLNILFRCTGNRTMEVVLGDVGGICEQKHVEQNASTYPPWEWKELGDFHCVTNQLLYGKQVSCY